MTLAKPLAALACLTCLLCSNPVLAQHILFIRGADRSGGYLEAKNDADRTEQLADITNGSTARKNHGWKTFADTLTEAGYEVTQLAEPLEPGSTQGQSEGRPLPLEEMDLSRYDVIVFGSNNARYGEEAVDAIEAYLRSGGAALFISDTNFGSDAADASDSDQPFLDRLGLTMNQDQGTYLLKREDGEFLAPDHPILSGIDTFDGEGVTPITVNDELPEGVQVTILARAKSVVRRNHAPFGRRNRGPSEQPTDNDAVLLALTIDQGRVVGHFDRNTFFNNNGAGTSIERFDNKQFALNLFAWLVGRETPEQ